ncbi:hypothetical protein NS226_17410 [Aureimonas ureilytica]|uniref:Uncharacterized protein n=1 Tax=Aureimonas ureilytica TaxID=401562 RepID=A0A175R736_9HYPH|nr:hypothetical protein [Aureimonas ureilytica]KTQ88026.1 hypothetical protein NS226_17410 [Aureimonas ureilytica]
MTNAMRIQIYMESKANVDARTTFCSRIVRKTMVKLRDESQWRQALPMLVGYTVNELDVDTEWETPNRNGVPRTRRAPVHVHLGDVGNPQQVKLVNSVFADALRGTLRVVAEGSMLDKADPFRLIGQTKEGQRAFSLQLAENPLYLSLRFG